MVAAGVAGAGQRQDLADGRGTVYRSRVSGGDGDRFPLVGVRKNP